jgi:predicted dehydrogenase
MQHSKQRGIEFHGDNGSLFLSSWQNFDAAIEVAMNGEAPRPVALPHAFPGTDWGRAIAELSSAIAEHRPHRANGAHAAHVVEILDAIVASAAEGRPVDVISSFQRVPVPSTNGSGPS